jgi:hypothetical protein
MERHIGPDAVCVFLILTPFQPGERTAPFGDNRFRLSRGLKPADVLVIAFSNFELGSGSG